MFNGGIPWALDAKRLAEGFPASRLTEGLVIGHDLLEPVVNAKKGSSRYYGVINSWIAQMKNQHGIIIVWCAKTGVKVLAPAELLDHAEKRTGQKIRQTVKTIGQFAWVDRNRLDGLGQQRLDHQLRVANVLRDALGTAKKEIALAPIPSLPKPKCLPGEGE